MLTENEIREEIKNIELYLKDLDSMLKDKSESDDFSANYANYRRYTHIKEAFEMVLNGIEYETGSY